MLIALTDRATGATGATGVSDVSVIAAATTVARDGEQGFAKLGVRELGTAIQVLVLAGVVPHLKNRLGNAKLVHHVSKV